MARCLWLACSISGFLATAMPLRAAEVVPTDVQQPGTQPGEVGSLEAPSKCDNCHGGYDTAVEPAHNWRGSMMSQAARDPIFWAALAVAEQDFDGAGDLCLRCHTPAGWLSGRSTPTDGSALRAQDAFGVTCDLCHTATNPDNSEHLGAQSASFVANDGGTPPVGYYGSGMYSVWNGSAKLGPYSDATANHQFLQSRFHRSVDFCGTCHDVSNPVVGDLAPGNGAQLPLASGTFSGTPGAPVDGKAAFNNFPFQYGVVERTYSEHKSSLLSSLLVSDYPSLPANLKAGALRAAYEAALVAGTGGGYEDGTPRYFSCQTCHMRPVTGKGCDKNPPLRKDLPLHDMTGGNYWMPDAIVYLDGQDKLRLGGGLTAAERAALTAGKARAQQQLREAATLSVTGNTLTVINHTGHKLISGYPEGRRMWLNVRWYSSGGILLREDGQYGTVDVSLAGTPLQVRTLVDLDDPHARVYEAHYAITQEWAARLSELGHPDALPLSYDRINGSVTYTLGQLRSQAPGTWHETFHFVLNDKVVKDNRIPPYGMSRDEASRRNALPVPASQYGNPGPGGAYDYWDSVLLDPPATAVSATIQLLYQPASWEHVQFLYLANDGQSSFLGQQGVNLLDAWLNTGMAEPYVMASIGWSGSPPQTETPTATPSLTPTPVPPSPTPTSTHTSTPTRTATHTPSPVPWTSTPTPTASGTATPSATPAETGTAAPTASGTATPSATPAETGTAAPTASGTATPSATPTETGTAAPTASGTATSTMMASPSPTPSPPPPVPATETPSPSPTAAEQTPSPTPSPSPLALPVGPRSGAGIVLAVLLLCAVAFWPLRGLRLSRIRRPARPDEEASGLPR
jgi:hypothetical protein